MIIKPFGRLPAIAIMCLSVGLINHVLAGPLLLDVAFRDSWMSVLAALLFILPWLAIPLYGVLKKMNRMPIDKWLLQRLHPAIAWALLGCFLLILFIIALSTLIITSSWTATTYLPNTPPIVIAAVFLALCLFASVSGLRTIAYTSCILLPLVVLLGDFVMSANMPHKDYRYLLPMLERGVRPVIQASLTSVTAFSELFVLLFIQHHMKRTLTRTNLVLLALFLALISIGPVIGAVAEFGPIEAEKMRYPAFTQWRLVSIGRYFEHVDFFAVFQWLAGALIRLSLCLQILEEFGPLRRLKRNWIFPSLLGVLLIVPTYFGLNNMMTYRDLLKWHFEKVGLIAFGLVVLVWAAGFLKARGKGGKKRRHSGTEEGMKG
ncbi:endospore germination permease [Paenibacillus arenilitoris]|uniref:Endospore germination permease n=1 Tax=Paenibacillus arenilitoris TaxID=2772299 RepID=A0A927H4J6_9BACL|nr:endospore germination permease [Paenibacillus arenilitoris]MBD2867558.1 endospore germination permease [Paenibacillus arenilitoris]